MNKTNDRRVGGIIVRFRSLGEFHISIYEVMGDEIAMTFNTDAYTVRVAMIDTNTLDLLLGHEVSMLAYKLPLDDIDRLLGRMLGKRRGSTDRGVLQTAIVVWWGWRGVHNTKTWSFRPMPDKGHVEIGATARF